MKQQKAEEKKLKEAEENEPTQAPSKKQKNQQDTGKKEKPKK